MKNLSPVFLPTDKPTHTGWYCTSSVKYYAENQRELLRCDLGQLLFPRNWSWYSAFWEVWFPSKYSIFPKTNQNQYWFGLVRKDIE